MSWRTLTRAVTFGLHRNAVLWLNLARKPPLARSTSLVPWARCSIPHGVDNQSTVPERITFAAGLGAIYRLCGSVSMSIMKKMYLSGRKAAFKLFKDESFLRNDARSIPGGPRFTLHLMVHVPHLPLFPL